jgi:hypothetical protein
MDRITKNRLFSSAIHPKAMPVILTNDDERDVLDARVMGRSKSVTASCRTTCSRSSCAVPMEDKFAA